VDVEIGPGGVAPAQYRVALSLLRGQGCEADTAKGYEWLLKAAQQDYPDAQVELAKLTLRTGPAFDPKKGMFWLERAVAAKDVKAKKYLAAVLATSRTESLRDARRAMHLIDDVLAAERNDILGLEIRAAAAAALGDTKTAVKTQIRAVAAATQRDWDIVELNERLATYQAGKPWYGDLIAF
jgi:TPR repeat protein